MDLNRRISSAYRKGAGKQEEDDSSKPSGGSGKEAAKDGKADKSAHAIKTVSRTSPAKPGSKAEDGKGKASGTLKSPGMGLPPGPKPEKAEIARYLLALGQDEAARILSFLKPEEVEDIAREIAKINHITSDEAHQVLARFKGLVKEGIPSQGGVDTARSMLTQAFGENHAKRIMAQALPETKDPWFSFLEDEDTDRVLQVLKPEASGVKAIVLAHIKPAKSAELLGRMSPQEQKELVVRLSRMQKVETEVIERIEKGLKSRLESLGDQHAQEVDGTSSLAAIMRHLDPDLEQRLLDALEEEAPVVAENIRERLFTVDTMLLIDDRDMQRVLATMENRQLAFFLKGKADTVRTKILANVSSNRAQLITDEYIQLGPQRKLDVDTATRDFILYLRRLEQEGNLRVRRKDDEFVE